MTFPRRTPLSRRWVLFLGAATLAEAALAQVDADVAGGGEGQKIFQTRCFVCHGRDGKGDGPAATGLGANPRDFTNLAWQRSIPDAKVRRVIREGGEAVGESSAMPPGSDLTDPQVDALVRFVRSLARP